MEAKEFLIEGIIPLVGMLMSFIMVGVLVLVISRARLRRLEIQADLQSKLIDKFGSTGELSAFLQSEVGRQFVSGVQTAGVRNVQDRASSAVRTGIVFAALGLAFLVLWPLTNVRGLVWPGVFLFVIGAASFASAYSMLRFANVRAGEFASWKLEAESKSKRDASAPTSEV